GRRFCFRLTDLQAHDIVLFRRLAEFLRGLFRNLSELRRAQTVIFVGNYEYTPPGVHTDPDPIFQYVVHGKKRACFWPREVWEKEPRDPHSASRYLEDATIFDVEEGDLVYWPMGQYHVFASSGFSVGLSIGLPDPLPAGSPEE